MNLKPFKTKLFLIIKVLSTGLMISAIALELWNIQFLTTNTALPNPLNIVLIIAHFALSAHIFEGLVAAFYAPAKKRSPVKYGVYTFFVGTVSLLELFDQNEPKAIDK